MRILKIIVLSILVLFLGIFFMGFSWIVADNYLTGCLEFAYEVPPLACILGMLVSAIVALIRAAVGKKWVILPMLGAMAAVFTGSIAFIEYAVASETGDGDYLAAGIVMTVLTLLIVLSMIAISKAREKSLSREKELRASYVFFSFDGLNAEKFSEEVLNAYLALNDAEGSAVSEVMLQDIKTKINRYACVYFAYLLVWLLRHDGISESSLAVWAQTSGTAAGIKGIADEEADPAAFLKSELGGNLSVNDLTYDKHRFLSSYYERYGHMNLSSGVTYERETSYGKDFDEIVKADSDAEWCLDFSWDKYRELEKRLDERYEGYLRNSADNRLAEREDKTFYSEALRQSLDVTAEVTEGVQEEYERYIDRCIEFVEHFPVELLEKVCRAFVEHWGVDWTGELEPETFPAQVDAGELIVYKPYGEELAFVLAFEADFEEEHGISFVIRGERVMSVGYRVDATSPWHTSVEKDYRQADGSQS